MCELSRLLSALKLDGRPVTCKHAVLISESGARETFDWVISILDVRPADFERVIAATSFSATGTEGQRFSGRLHSRPASSLRHVRLQGGGPLRELREVRAHLRGGGADGALELATLREKRANPFDLKSG